MELRMELLVLELLVSNNAKLAGLIRKDLKGLVAAIDHEINEAIHRAFVDGIVNGLEAVDCQAAFPVSHV